MNFLINEQKNKEYYLNNLLHLGLNIVLAVIIIYFGINNIKYKCKIEGNNESNDTEYGKNNSLYNSLEQYLIGDEEHVKKDILNKLIDKTNNILVCLYNSNDNIKKDPNQTGNIKKEKENAINNYVKQDFIPVFIPNITTYFLQSAFDTIIKQIQYNNRSTDNKFNITEHDNQIIKDIIYRINNDLESNDTNNYTHTISGNNEYDYYNIMKKFQKDIIGDNDVDKYFNLLDLKFKTEDMLKDLSNINKIKDTIKLLEDVSSKNLKDPTQTKHIKNNRKNYIDTYITKDFIPAFISNRTSKFLQSTFDCIIKQIQNDDKTNKEFIINKQDYNIIKKTIYRINK